MSVMTSGRVRTRFSLQPSSAGPPKSAAVSFRRWIIVPMAPSRQRIFSLKRARRRLPRSVMGTITDGRLTITALELGDPPVRDDHLERLVSLAISMPDAHALEPGVAKQLPQLRRRESQAGVAEARADPGLAVAAEVEHEHAAARGEDPPRLGDGPDRVFKAVQDLRE